MVEYWSHGIELKLGIPLSLMSHGQKQHDFPRLEARVLLNDTHCNFRNGGSNAIKLTTRSYGKTDHLSHS